MFGRSPCSKKAAAAGCVKCQSCNRSFNGRLRFNGHHLRTKFCSSCFCRHVAGSRACPNPRISALRAQGLTCGGDLVRDIPWCFEHVTCTDLGAVGGHCRRIVKQGNPAKFPFCDAHGCASPDCPAPKPADHPCCPDHRCSTPGCATPRPPRPYRHCATHTCEVEDCTMPCDGLGPPGSAARRCVSHRSCAVNGCGRVCHRRDDGRTGTYCGAHYCRYPGCAAPRCALLGGAEYAGYDDEATAAAAAAVVVRVLPDAAVERALGWGAYCEGHMCRFSGCGGARTAPPGMGGMWCAAHECAADGCRERRRRGGSWCLDHVCERRGCTRQAVLLPGGEGYCERHRRCEVVNCNEDRWADGERVDERCGRHNYVPCRWDRCEKRCVPESSHCEDHVCSHRACVNGRLPAGSIYCGAHKCAVAGCDAIRRDPDAAAPPPGALPYCADHACHAAGCGLQAAGAGRRHCATHECAASGCADLGTVPAPPGHPALSGRAAAAGMVLCERHYGGYGYGGLGGWLPGPGPWMPDVGGGGSRGGGFGDFLGGMFGGGGGGRAPWGGGGRRQRGIHLFFDEPGLDGLGYGDR